MNTTKKRKECFGEKTLMKEECLDCEDAVDCIMTLYDKPLPSLILYSSDLSNVKAVLNGLGKTSQKARQNKPE